MRPAALTLIATVAAAAALAGPPLLSPTAEGARTGAAYYMGRVGSSWSYATGDKKESKAKVTVESIENWASRFHVDWGKRSISGTWRVRESAWVEKLPGHEESIVLPGQLTVGTRWSGPSSIERGNAGKSKFEIISTDAQVELPNGGTRYGCVAVLETGEAGGPPITHFYAPSSGKVAVQNTEGWMLRLLEFRPGRGGGGE